MQRARAARTSGRRRMADQIASFSTDMLPAQDRYDRFRDEFARRVVRLDVQGTDPAAFYAHIKFAELGPLNCGWLEVAPASYGRTTDLLADGNDDLVILINRGGMLLHERTGRTIPRDGLLLADNSCADRMIVGAEGSLLNVRVPRHKLKGLVPAVEDTVWKEIDGTAAAARLLTGYVCATLQDGSRDRAFFEQAGQHVLELAALALSGNSRLAAYDGRGAVKAARLAAVQRCIRQSLGDPALSLPLVAGLNAISERYVQLLFEEQGTNFTAFVLAERLDLAHRWLVDPLHRGRQIADIAYSAGFSDLSHFNRSFRRRFGATPSLIRRGGG